MANCERSGVGLKRLRYFVAVCDHGGFSRAAAVLGMAQPALTRQIQILEQEVGLSLLIRTGRGAEPTEQGRYLLSRTRAPLEELDDVVRATRETFLTEPRQIALGICPTVTPLFLDDLQIWLRENHPELMLTVIEAYSGDLENLMGCGQLDLALSYGPIEGSGRSGLDLLSERLVLVTGEAGKPSGSQTSLAELGRMRLILPSRVHQLRRLIDRISARRGIRLEPDLELDSLGAVKALLAKPALNYATILPFHSVKAEAETGPFRCYQFEEPEMQRTISVMQPPEPAGGKLPSFLIARICAQADALKSRLETVF